MSAHTLPHDLLIAPWKVADPGSGGTLDLQNKGRASCGITTAAAEARTIPAPELVAQVLFVHLDTDGGDCTITVNGGQGVTSVVLDDAGDWFVLESISVGGTAKWVVRAQSGVLSGATQNFGADTLQVGGVIVNPNKTVEVNCVLNSGCVDHAFFTADRAYQVTGVTEIHAVAGTDAGAVNLQVVKDTGTAAPGAGTDLLTNNANAGFDMKGVANTLQNGTLTGTVASLQLAAGDRLSLDFAGVVTTLAGVQVTVKLKAI